MNPWIVLGITETDDTNALRQAYMAKVAHHNPEEDPEGFQNVRLAYETALKQIEESPKEDTTPIDQFITKVGKLYKNFARRIDVEQWRELLSDPICTSFEFEDELSLRLLDFLMGHYYLPQAVWQLLDSKFNWVAQAEELSKDIHPGFLSFVTNSLQQESNLKLELFDATQDRDFDRFISLGAELNNLLDDRNLEAAAPLIEELEALDIAHPSYSFIKAHYLALVGKTQEALNLLDSTLALYGQAYQESATPDFVKATILSTFTEDKEKQAVARDIFKALSERFSPYYFAQLGYLETLDSLGQWEVAFEYIRDEMIHHYPSAIYVMNLYIGFGARLAETYQARYDQDPTDEALALTLAKYYLYSYAGTQQQIYDILAGIKNHTAEFHELMGICLVDQGEDFERAEEHLLKAVALNPTYRTYGSLVFAYERFNQYEKVVALMPEIETLPPPEKLETYTHAMNFISFAIGLKKAGKLDEATQALDTAEQLSPNLSRIFLERARIAFMTGDLPKAVSYAEHTLSLSSQSSTSAFEVLLDVFESINNVEEMDKVLERVDSLQQQSHGITLFRASALIFKEKDEEAAKLLEELITQDNLGDWGKKAYQYLATCYQYLGRKEEFIKLWQAYIDLYPTDASGHNRKAMALFDQGCLDEALETVNKGLQNVQTDVCRYNLKLRKAIILQRQKQNRKAIEELVSVIDNWCEGIWFQKDVMCGKLSDLYDELTEAELAIKYATLGIEANPEHVDCLYTLGLLKSYYSKDYQAAITHFTKLLTVDEEKYSVYYERGHAYTQLGETELAHADFRQTIALANHAIADDQADGEVPYHGMYRYLALAHLALGDVTTARDMLETADKQQLLDGTGANNCFCVYQTYAVLHASQGDYEQALPYIERAGELRSTVKNGVLKAQMVEALARG